MTWQLGAFAILGIALIGGFGWYERSRPDARIVALVATLAAFAALGRIAFAALPNVKPTTDIVLISGYALGAGPGFVVGALAGLTSNFFFGQGPWTPWQMAGWGATGLLGAALAIATRGRIGRWPLALSCAVAGFGFTVLQDVGDWITYSDHGLAQLGVYVGKGLGFDTIHAAGCLAFALAFGPALLRSIARFAARLQVNWVAPGRASATVGIALAVALGVSLGAPRHTASAAATPTDYLLGAQNSDGGLGAAPGQASSQLYSGWAALGLAAEGKNPGTVRRGGPSLLAYLQAGAGSASDPGSVERLTLAVTAAGASATSVGGRDLVAALEHDLRRDGSVSDQVNLTSFAVLALRAAGVAPPASTFGWLVRQQDSDGGFNFATGGGSSDADDTGAVLEALAGAPGSATARARARAVGFLGRTQDSDGGFASSGGGGSNAQSTAWAAQGLLAAGAGGSAVDRALRYLNSLIAPDGHVRYSHSSDQTPVWVTGEALMALARKPLPLAPVTVPSQGRYGSRRTSGHRRTRGGASARHRRRAGSGSRTQASPEALTIATDLGVAAAVALAPVGLG
jgi:energy-coupling factor transport system substrate-specific component